MVRVKCLAQEIKRMIWPGLECGPLDLESIMLTDSSPGLFFFNTVSINGSKPGINSHVYNVIIQRKVALRGIDISKSD